MTRVFLVAESSRARERLEEALEAADMEVAGTAADFDNFRHEIPTNTDVTLADAGEEPLSEVLETIEESGALAATRVALLTDDATPVFVNQALRAGVRGILPVEVDGNQLSAAIRAIALGLVVLYPSELRISRQADVVEEIMVEPLTPREREVLQMLAQGKSNREVAARLKISEHTAKFHVASVLGKLRAATRAEAVSIGMRRGLILL
jgi:DNA-binding NarL/FixJ family response regulator